jgi:hypothetical protein
MKVIEKIFMFILKLTGAYILIKIVYFLIAFTFPVFYKEIDSALKYLTGGFDIFLVLLTLYSIYSMFAKRKVSSYISPKAQYNVQQSCSAFSVIFHALGAILMSFLSVLSIVFIFGGFSGRRNY